MPIRRRGLKAGREVGEVGCHGGGRGLGLGFGLMIRCGLGLGWDSGTARARAGGAGGGAKAEAEEASRSNALFFSNLSVCSVAASHPKNGSVNRAEKALHAGSETPPDIWMNVGGRGASSVVSVGWG